MLFLAKEITKTQPATMAFKERGINLTQARISDVTCLGKARSPQLAYAGYKDNIEAFLFATATKEKVLCEGSVYTIPDSYIPTVPLPLPQVIFKPAKKFSESQMKLMFEKLDNQGIKKVDLGKGEPNFTLSNPVYKTLTQILPPLCLASTAFVDSHAQMEAAVSAVRLYQCVDLFLATNTYYYKADEFSGEKQGSWKDSSVAKLQEARINSWFWREDTNKDVYEHKFRKGDDGKKIREDLPDEKKDLTPDRRGYIQMQDVVHVAKPSPLPSSTNFGPPSSVPFVPGLIFPYFAGLLVPDAAGFRALVSSLFFRNMGSSKSVPKESFIEFRKTIGTFVNTPQGVLMTHVLKGVELALETQAVLYLLFDGQAYMGFCILGTEFDIFMQGKWHAPMTAQALKDALQSMRTHEQSLEDLAAVLKKMKLVGGEVALEDIGTLETCADIAEILAKLDLSFEEDSPDPEIEISAILSRISFKDKPLTFKPANIAQSIKYLVGEEAFPRGAYFHIPLKKWSGIDTKEYRIFAQYGPRSFSLRNAKGEELLIRKEVKEVDIFEAKDDKGKLKYPKFLVGEKVISQCIQDWEALVEKRSMRMDFVERAAGSRNHVFARDIFKPIWEALLVGAGSGAIGTKAPKTEKKRVHDVAFGEGAFDESAFD